MRYLIILTLIMIASCNRELIVSGENSKALILRTADVKVFVIKKDKKYKDYFLHNYGLRLQTLDTVLYSFSKHRVIAVRRKSFVCPNIRIWELLNYSLPDTIYVDICNCKK